MPLVSNTALREALQTEPDPVELPFGEGLAAVYEAGRLADQSISTHNQLSDALQASMQRLGELGGPTRDVPWPLLDANADGVLGFLDENAETIQGIRARGGEGPPDPFLKTGEEIRNDVRGRVTAARMEAERAGLGAQVVGGFGVAFTDPLNLAALPLGAGSGQGLLVKMVSEAGVGAVSQAAVEVASLEAKERGGVEPSLAASAANVGFTAAGAGLLTGLFHGVGAATRKLGLLERYRSGVGEGRIRETPQSQTAADAVQDHLDTITPGASPGEEAAQLDAVAAATDVLRTENPVLKGAARSRLDAATARVGEEATAATRAPRDPLFAGQRGLTVEQLYERAPQSQDELMAKLTRIAKADGLEVYNPGVKRFEDAVDKQARSGLAAEQLPDIPRARYLAETPEQADRAVRQLSLTNLIRDRGWVRTASGYFDRKVSVRLNTGSVAEVQISTPALHRAEALTHPLYEEQRGYIQGDWVRPENRQRYLDLEAEQRAIYEKAIGEAPEGIRGLYWATDQRPNRLLNSSSVSGRASREMLSGEAGPQSPSAVLATKPRMPSSGESTILAGRSSNSKNVTAEGMGETVPQRAGDPQGDTSAAATREPGEWTTETEDVAALERAIEERPELEGSYQLEDGTIKAGSARELLAELDEEQTTLNKILDCILTPDVEG